MNNIDFMVLLFYATIGAFIFYKYFYKKYRQKIQQQKKEEKDRLYWENWRKEQDKKFAEEKQRLAQEIDERKKHNETIFAEGEPVYMVFDAKVNEEVKDYNAPVSKEWLLPHLISICWLIYDIKGSLIRKENFIVKPEVFKIDDYQSKRQGITNEIANQLGVGIKTVLEGFRKDLKTVKMLIAHKISWDKKIMDVEFSRNKIPKPFKGVYLFCTMENSVDYCAIEHNYSKLHAKGERYKYPSLDELYDHVFYKEVEGDSAEDDAKACAACFFELINKGVYKITFSVEKEYLE